MALTEEEFKSIDSWYNDDYSGFLYESKGPLSTSHKAVYMFAEAYAEYRLAQERKHGGPQCEESFEAGQDNGAAIIIQKVNAILDGTVDNVGVSNEPWQSLKQRLFDIRELLGCAHELVQVLNVPQLKEVQHSKKSWDAILKWFRIRYAVDPYRKDVPDADRG